jgi:methionyl-tRNA synthetase
MLLAASRKNAEGGETVEVLDAGNAAPGSRVTFEGVAPPAAAPAEISIDAFFSVPISVKGGGVAAGGKRLLVNGAPLLTKVVLDGEVG